LDRERSHGFSPTRIPFLSIVKYARLFNYSAELEDDLIYYVTGIDDHHIQQLNEELKKNSSRKK
jgi:hypothetical protein